MSSTATMERLDLDQVVRTYAKKYQLPEDRVATECERVDAEIARIKNASDAVLKREFKPIEKLAAERITAMRQARIKTLEAKKAEIVSSVTYRDLDADYARIDMSFNSRRMKPGKYGMPRPQFALFDLSNQVCSLSVDSNGGVGASPSDLTTYWSDIVDALKIKAKIKRSKWDAETVIFDLRTEFGLGRIPDATRDKIKVAQPRFDRLFVVTEAPKWDYKLVVVPKPRPIAIADPLVIGAKGGYFWLVDAFDLTSAEAYIKREFTYSV